MGAGALVGGLMPYPGRRGGGGGGGGGGGLVSYALFSSTVPVFICTPIILLTKNEFVK